MNKTKNIKHHWLLLLLGLICFAPLQAQKEKPAKNRQGNPMTFEECGRPKCEVDAGIDQVFCGDVEETLLEGTVICSKPEVFDVCWINMNTLEEECSTETGNGEIPVSLEVFGIEETTTYRLQVRKLGKRKVYGQDEVVMTVMDGIVPIEEDKIHSVRVPFEPGGVVENEFRNRALYGMVFPENYPEHPVELNIEFCLQENQWRPFITEVTGPHSLTARLIPGCQEVTGIDGNTTPGNYCDQVSELLIPPNEGRIRALIWYMLDAVVAHEEIHAEKFKPSLIRTTRIFEEELKMDYLFLDQEEAQTYEDAKRIWYERHYAKLVKDFYDSWDNDFDDSIDGDHATGGPTEQAEEAVKFPMVKQICCHAKTTLTQTNPWPECEDCSNPNVPPCN